MISSVGVRPRVAAATFALLMSSVAMYGCATPPSGVEAPMAASVSASPSGGTPSPSGSPDPSPSALTPTPVPAPVSGAGDVTVIFVTLEVFDGTLEASGMIPEVVEEGGECTLTLTRGSETRSVSSVATVGPKSTFCGLMAVRTTELEPGDWEAALAYRSTDHSGTSATQLVSVP